MADGEEYRCFIGGLSWSTTDDGLKDAFKKFGHLVEAKVVVDKFSGKSRGFGFVSFEDKKSMEEAIEAMHNMDLDGRTITVDKAQQNQGRGDRDGDRDRDRGRESRGGGEDRDRDRGREYRGGGVDRDRDRGRDSRGGGGRGGGGDCYQCGKPGHFARECPSGDGGRGGKYGGRDDRYGGGGGGGRYASDRNGDRHSSHGSRDGGSRGGSGSDRYSRDRSGPYDRPSGGSSR